MIFEPTFFEKYKENLINLHIREGLYSLFDCQILYSAVREIKPKIVVELSPGNGRTTSCIAQALKDNGDSVEYFLFEMQPNFLNNAISFLKKFPNINIHPGTNVINNPNLDLINNVDFLMIDSNHDYVLANYYMKTLFPKVKNEGLIHIHDIYYDRNNKGWKDTGLKYLLGIEGWNCPDICSKKRLLELYGSEFSKNYPKEEIDRYEEDEIKDFIIENNIDFYSTRSIIQKIGLSDSKQDPVPSCSVYFKYNKSYHFPTLVKKSTDTIIENKINTDITIIWSFRNRLSVLLKSIKTADETCPKDVKFYLADGASNDEMHKELRKYCSELNRKICICETFYRTTCQEAWNLGIMLSDTQYVIIASSDVVFKPGWYEAITNALQSGHKYVLIYNHAIFGLNKSLIKEIGFFDEDFGHGPHADVDFMLRASEKNIHPFIIKNNNYFIHDEENISCNDRLNESTGDRLIMDSSENEERFMKKWKSNWPGWAIYKGKNVSLPHPPQSTKINRGNGLAKRMIPETDYHPAYIKKIK